MCYGARCLWEDEKGNCRLPANLILIDARYKCDVTLDDYLIINRQITRNKRILQRKDKIISLKTKLLHKSEYISEN